MKDQLWFLGDESEDGETLIGSVAIMVTATPKPKPGDEGHCYLVQELNGERKVEISFRPEDGAMLFDGEYVYTEDFMIIVGMIDEVDEAETGKVVFVGEEMFK